LNAFFSIRDNFDSDSKVTDESNRHFEKQFTVRNSTDEGILRNFNAVSEKIFVGMCSKIERFSNTIDRKPLLWEKHLESMISMNEGIHRILSMKRPVSIAETWRIVP
jgi:hypothetical protein